MEATILDTPEQMRRVRAGRGSCDGGSVNSRVNNGVYDEDMVQETNRTTVSSARTRGIGRLHERCREEKERVRDRMHADPRFCRW